MVSAGAHHLKYAQGLDLFLQHLPEEAFVVEIACGNSNYTKAFAQSGADVYVIADSDESWMGGNPYAKEVSHKPFFQQLIPYRSVHGIWLQKFLSQIEKKAVQDYLHTMHDWLAPEGILSLSVLEGEGHKVITRHDVSGPVTVLQVYYTVEELNDLLILCDFEIIHAWRELESDHYLIHVLCKI
jgi:hypothetical protein